MFIRSQAFGLRDHAAAFSNVGRRAPITTPALESGRRNQKIAGFKAARYENQFA